MNTPQIVESYAAESDSPHLAKIKGRFMVEGKKTANKRIWTNFEAMADDANERIARGAVVEMRCYHSIQTPDRTETQNTLNVVGKVTKVNPDGTYEGMIANTVPGKDTYNQIRGEYLSGVSIRSAPGGEADFIKDGGESVMVVKKWKLNGIDFTNQPGASDAFVSLAETQEDGGMIDWMTETEAGDAYYESMTAGLRKKRSSDGDAMADGKFPIANQSELDAAVHLIGNSTEPESSIKAHIRKQAKKYGLKLPDSWTSSKESTSGDGITEGVNAVTDPVTDPVKDIIEDTLAPVVEALEGDPVAAAKAKAEAVVERKAALIESTADAKTVNEVIKAALGETPKPEPTTEAETEDPLTEAGAAVSSANKGKLKGAHDVIASMGGFPCAPDADNDGETAKGQAMTESFDLKGLVEATVRTTLTEAQKIFAAQLESVEERHQKELDEVRHGRRKSHALLESQGNKPADENDTENMTLEQICSIVAADRGIELSRLVRLNSKEADAATAD